MANKSISQLTAGGAVSGTDLFPDVQTAGVGPVKVTATQLATYFWNSPTLVTPSLGAATATSINIGGATLGTNKLAVNGTTLLGGATTVSTGGLTIGVAGTTGGTIALKGSTAGTLTLQVPATVTDYSITLPSAVAAGNGYILTSTTGGVTSWTNPTSLGIDLDVGTTAITNGTVGRVLFEGTGNVLQESANLFWDNTNIRLGIGTSSPAYLLDLYSPASIASGQCRLRLTGTTNYTLGIFNNTGGSMWIGTESSVGGSAANGSTAYAGLIGTSNSTPVQFLINNTVTATLDTSGNFGIGTSSPSLYGKFAVVNSAAGSVTPGAVLVNNSSNSVNSGVALYFDPNGAQLARAASIQSVQTTSGNYANLQFFVAGGGTPIQAMTLDTSGNLGVGVSPSYKLDVSNAGSNTIAAVRSAAGFASYLSLAGNATTPLSTSFDLIFDGTAYLYNRSSGALTFGTNNIERARFAATTATLSIGTSAATNPGAIQLYGSTSGSSTITVAAVAGSSTWTFQNPGGNVNVGYLNIPQNAQTSAYVAVVGDVGKHISITTGGVTVNASVFSAGDVFTIYNNSGSSQNITAGAGVTFRLAGTATSGTPRTVAQYGLATVLCVTGGASPVFVLSGAGVA